MQRKEPLPPMHTILWFIYFWLYLIVVLPVFWYVKGLARRGDTARHDPLVRRVVGRWARRMLWAARAKVTVDGLENLPGGPAVYVANHQGYFDIPLVLGYLGSDTKPLLAKKEIARIPLIRGWMRQLQCVFLDRENPRSAVASINAATEIVAAGYSMVVFPEGTRSKTGQVADFKPGAFKIAQKNKVPVVPFVIEGTAGLMERNHNRIHGGSVFMRVLPPLDTAGYTREDWRALPALCEGQVRQALEALRAELAGNG